MGPLAQLARGLRIPWESCISFLILVATSWLCRRVMEENALVGRKYTLTCSGLMGMTLKRFRKKNFFCIIRATFKIVRLFQSKN